LSAHKAENENEKRMCEYSEKYQLIIEGLPRIWIQFIKKFNKFKNELQNLE